MTQIRISPLVDPDYGRTYVFVVCNVAWASDLSYFWSTDAAKIPGDGCDTLVESHFPKYYDKQGRGNGGSAHNLWLPLGI